MYTVTCVHMISSLNILVLVESFLSQHQNVSTAGLGRQLWVSLNSTAGKMWRYPLAMVFPPCHAAVPAAVPRSPEGDGGCVFIVCLFCPTGRQGLAPFGPLLRPRLRGAAELSAGDGLL